MAQTGSSKLLDKEHACRQVSVLNEQIESRDTQPGGLYFRMRHSGFCVRIPEENCH